MGVQNYDEAFVSYRGYQILPADGTTSKNLGAAKVYHTRVDAIIITTTAVAIHDLLLTLTDGSFTYVLGTVQVPIGAGYGAVPPFEALAALAVTNMPSIILPAQATLNGKLAVTLGAGEVMDVVLIGGALA